MNWKLNIDGPVTVPNAVREKYQQLELSTKKPFDHLFYIWIDDGYNDGIRRLALRDLLRQGTTARDHGPELHFTGEHFSRLLYIGEKDKPRELFWQLHNRRKLREEFLQELTYNLDNRLYDTSVPKVTQDLNDLLEIVFRVADETEGRKLLPHYRIWNNGFAPNIESARQLINTWADHHNPEWLRDTLYVVVKAALVQDISKINIRETDRQDSNLTQYAHSPRYTRVVLSAVVDFINKRAKTPRPSPQDIASVAQLFDIMQWALPHEICLVPYGTLIPLLYAMNDDDAALKYIKLHLSSGNENRICNVRLHEAMHFYYWLLGFVSHIAPDDQDLLRSVYWLRAVITAKCKD